VVVRVSGNLFWTIPWAVLASERWLVFKSNAVRAVEIASDDPAWTALSVSYRDGAVRRLFERWYHARSERHRRSAFAWQADMPPQSVSVSCTVAADGSVGDIGLSASSGDPTYDELALEAVGGARLRPPGQSIRLIVQLGALGPPKRRRSSNA
jgi:TonB family protein